MSTELDSCNNFQSNRKTIGTSWKYCPSSVTNKANLLLQNRFISIIECIRMRKQAQTPFLTFFQTKYTVFTFGRTKTISQWHSNWLKCKVKKIAFTAEIKNSTKNYIWILVNKKLKYLKKNFWLKFLGRKFINLTLFAYQFDAIKHFIWEIIFENDLVVMHERNMFHWREIEIMGKIWFLFFIRTSFPILHGPYKPLWAL